MRWSTCPGSKANVVTQRSRRAGGSPSISSGLATTYSGYVTRTSAIFVLFAARRRDSISLVLGAIPALREFGPAFLTTESWNPVTEKFGAVAPVFGTLITSFIAMGIAVPLGLLIAMFLT